MGRLEKIVVIVVLFLVAVILGISLGSEGEGESAGPVASGRNGRAPRNAERATNEATKAPVTPLEGAGTEAPAPGSAGGLMNASGVATDPKLAGPAASAPNAPAASSPTAPGSAVATTPESSVGTPPAQPVQPAPQAQPLAAQYLVSRDGLEPTASDELMLHTWKAGDTFKALSEKYYGSPLHVARVRAANEGRKEETLVAGDKLLISVAPAAASDRIARSVPKEASANATTTWTGGPYTVGSGDVLSTISQKVYGTSKKWKRIYDANRDVIGDDPNKLKVGSQLRIPE